MTSTRGLAHGTELGRAIVAGRTLVYTTGAGNAVWCAEAGGDSVGVVVWGEACTPHLLVAAGDRWACEPQSGEAERAVWCAMALWRHVVRAAPLDLRLGVRPNPALQARSGRLYAAPPAKASRAPRPRPLAAFEAGAAPETLLPVAAEWGGGDADPGPAGPGSVSEAAATPAGDRDHLIRPRLGGRS